MRRQLLGPALVLVMLLASAAIGYSIGRGQELAAVEGEDVTTSTTTAVPAGTSPPTTLFFGDYVRGAAITDWVNQLGGLWSESDVWNERLSRACLEGVWKEEVALKLSAEFIAVDALSPRNENFEVSDETVASGARVLWLIAVNSCRNMFPPGVAEAGPP